MEITNDKLKAVLGDAFDENMSAEDVITAIGNSFSEKTKKELDDSHQKEVNKLKGYISRANGETAEYKRKFQEKLSDAEKEQAEREEAYEAMKNELADLKRTNAINAQVAQLTAMGYDQKLANEQATALVDNDLDKVLAIQKEFLESHDKEVVAKGMAGMKRPSSGKADGMDEKAFAKMTLDERLALKREDPELYEELRKEHFSL